MTHHDTLHLQRDITIQGQKLETVEHFKCLGAIISDESSRREVLSRAAQTMATLPLKNIWKDKDDHNKIQNKTNARALVITISFMHVTLGHSQQIQRRIQSLEFRCLLVRKILGIYIYIGECVSVCVSFQAYTRRRLWSDRDQIWHTHADSPRKGSAWAK